MLLDTGLRVSELRDLQLCDVDREHGLLLVRGKEASSKQVTLSPQGWHELRDYLEQH